MAPVEPEDDLELAQALEDRSRRRAGHLDAETLETRLDHALRVIAVLVMRYGQRTHFDAHELEVDTADLVRLDPATRVAVSGGDKRINGRSNLLLRVYRG